MEALRRYRPSYVRFLIALELCCIQFVIFSRYKDLVAVQRSAVTKQIQVMSTVYEITQVEGFSMFPRRAVPTYR
jgi:hypothetical protein